MTARSSRSTLEAATSRLRALAFATAEGALIGGEAELIVRLGVSRATIRQAARMLEAEGLLAVRRGPSGGYFSARPSTDTLETVFGSYLAALNLDIEETFIVGFALWTEVVRQAAILRTPEAKAMTRRFRQKLSEMSNDVPLIELSAFEDDYRRSVFQLVQRPYVELMFTLNRAVTWRHYTVPALGRDGEARDPAFVVEWRKSKRFELDAIEEGDESLALMAATRDRTMWRERLVRHNAALELSQDAAPKTGV
jgi:GntR family transcriptional repressor for pyruvate dehydrogenase complex